MYEKLCAILDSLREHGITCKVETNAYSGIWEIVALVPIACGVKFIRYPLSYSFIESYTTSYLVSHVIKEVLA